VVVANTDEVFDATATGVAGTVLEVALAVTGWGTTAAGTAGAAAWGCTTAAVANTDEGFVATAAGVAATALGVAFAVAGWGTTTTDTAGAAACG
jgi:hypothetical protein